MAPYSLTARLRGSVQRLVRPLVMSGLAMASGLVTLGLLPLPGTGRAEALNAYCQVSQEAAIAKENLRTAALAGDATA
jgi:hypothetical protein